MTINQICVNHEAGATRLRFALLFNQDAQSSSSRRGLLFTHALLRREHQLLGIFLMDAAVLHANPKQQCPSDEYPLQSYWQHLSEHRIPLYLCASAAERFGLHSPQDLAPGFEITGLGSWIELSQQADRVLTF